MELVLILLIALVVFGPSKLPKIGGAVGEAIREFKKGTADLTKDLTVTTAPTPQPAAPAPQPAAPAQPAPEVVAENAEPAPKRES